MELIVGMEIPPAVGTQASWGELRLPCILWGGSAWKRDVNQYLLDHQGPGDAR